MKEIILNTLIILNLLLLLWQNYISIKSERLLKINKETNKRLEALKKYYETICKGYSEGNENNVK